MVPCTTDPFFSSMVTVSLLSFIRNLTSFILLFACSCCPSPSVDLTFTNLGRCEGEAVFWRGLPGKRRTPFEKDRGCQTEGICRGISCLFNKRDRSHQRNHRRCQRRARGSARGQVAVREGSRRRAMYRNKRLMQRRGRSWHRAARCVCLRPSPHVTLIAATRGMRDRGHTRL